MGRLNAKRIAAAVIIVCLAGSTLVQWRIDRLHTRLRQENAVPTQLPLSAAASAALGGFRGIAVDILWMRADAMLNDKQFYQLMTYYELISALQPNFPSVWSYNAWNLSYNISAEWAKPEEKWLWINKGLEFTKKGLEYNPNSVELLFSTGWIYFNKIGGDEYFTRKLFEETGQEPYLVSYGYFSTALKAAQEQGINDPRLSGLLVHSLFRHGQAVERSGNVPEAMKYFNQAEDYARALLVQFPDDPAFLTALAEIQATKAKYNR